MKKKQTKTSSTDWRVNRFLIKEAKKRRQQQSVKADE